MAEIITGEAPPVQIKFIHSSGPGGQNVNKVATAAQLRLDLGRAGLTDYQRARLMALAPGQITKDGFLVITARNHRTQSQNKDEAMARLAGLLARAKAPPPRPRKVTRPTQRAVERRLSEKKRRAQSKAGRTAVKSED